MSSTRSSAPAIADPGDFSVVLGGPLYQFFRRAHLSGDALQLARRRVLATVALVWLPLLILSVVEGLAWGTKAGVAVPFLYDIEAQGRFLVVVPLLVASELIVHQRLRSIASQFMVRGLIPESAQPQFAAALETTARLRNSVVAEVAMIVLVYVLGLLFTRHQLTAVEVATWYARPSGGGGHSTLSPAGLWYLYFSVPVAQFLLLRWYYRMFIWARFLWQVARIDLRLVPTHPDRVGGLRFLALATSGFAPLAVAHGALVSAWIASRILLHGATLVDFKVIIIAVAVWMLLLFLGPFLFFTPQLARTRREGERDYGPLAQRYSDEFDAKWVHADPPSRERLLGTADIQSLADLANVYATVSTMRTTPITRQAVVQLLASTLAPIAPLALTMMPLAQIVKLLFGMLM